VNSVLGHARPSSNDVRFRGDARGEGEDERKGAGVSSTSPTHGGVTRRNRTRASRVGVEPDTVRVWRLGKSLGLRARAKPIRSQGVWRVDGFFLNRGSKVAPRLAGQNRTGAEGRSSELVARQRSRVIGAREWQGTQRSERFRLALPVVQAERHTARRVGIRGAELQIVERASPSKKAQADFA